MADGEDTKLNVKAESSGVDPNVLSIKVKDQLGGEVRVFGGRPGDRA